MKNHEGMDVLEIFLDAASVWVKKVPVLAPTGKYGTQNNLSLWNFVLKEALFKSSFARKNLVWSLSPSRTTLLEPLFRRWVDQETPKSSVFVKLVNLQHICCVRLAYQEWPYPSSLSFTAHSSISPKASKRRFSSVLVQSDLSRPTYTTRLSSCSLKGKTDRKARDYRWKSCFFVTTPSSIGLDHFCEFCLFCHRLSLVCPL